MMMPFAPSHDDACDRASSSSVARLIELLKRDVADLAVEHDRVRHGGNAHDGARERDRDRLVARRVARTSRRPWCRDVPLRTSETCWVGPAAGVRGVDLNDPIAFDDAGRFGGRVRKYALHGDEALDLADLHSDAAVLTAGLGVESRRAPSATAKRE